MLLPASNIWLKCMVRKLDQPWTMYKGHTSTLQSAVQYSENTIRNHIIWEHIQHLGINWQTSRWLVSSFFSVWDIHLNWVCINETAIYRFIWLNQFETLWIINSKLNIHDNLRQIQYKNTSSFMSNRFKQKFGWFLILTWVCYIFTVYVHFFLYMYIVKYSHQNIQNCIDQH